MSGPQEDDKTELLAGELSPDQAPVEPVIIPGAADEATVQLPHAVMDPTELQASTPRSRRRRSLWPVFIVIAGLGAAGLLLWQWSSPGPQPGGDQVRDILPAALTLAEASLQNDTTQSLPSQILKLQEDYPESEKLSSLLADSNRFLLLQRLVASNEVVAAAQQRKNGPFAFSLFEHSAVENIDGHLPPPNIIEQLQQAESDWRGGQLVQAIETARQLTQSTSNEIAAAYLAHYSRTVAQYNALASLATAADYPSHLLAFYLGLDPLRDQFYWRRLEKDFTAGGDELEDGPQDQLHSAGQLCVHSRQLSRREVKGLEIGETPVSLAKTPVQGNTLAISINTFFPAAFCFQYMAVTQPDLGIIRILGKQPRIHRA
jgi:hypothetical protein